MEKIAETQLSVVTANLDVKIKDFFTATKEVCEYHSKKFENFPLYFSATAFPNGVDEDWLSVRVRVIVSDSKSHNHIIGLKWAVSIIDIEGRTRFTRYFENPKFYDFLSIPSKEFPSENLSLPEVFEISTPDCRIVEFSEASYLEKSFILNRADEFLSDGVLFLRCDISVDIDVIKYIAYVENPLSIFMSSIPQVVCYKNGAETGNSSDSYTVFDFTKQVLILPQFHELRKRFGVYGISPELASTNLEEDTTDILEHVWIFDTRPDRFLLSLAPIPGNVGHLLVNASRVIRRCVNSPMKEQLEKRVEFPEVDSETFQIVLHFLKSGDIEYKSFSEIREVYKFSHLYEMENLQLKCVPCIALSETQTQFEETEEIAELYSDTYLFRQLQLHKRRHVEHTDTFEKDDRLDFDFYN